MWMKAHACPTKCRVNQLRIFLLVNSICRDSISREETSLLGIMIRGFLHMKRKLIDWMKDSWSKTYRRFRIKCMNEITHGLTSCITCNRLGSAPKLYLSIMRNTWTLPYHGCKDSNKGFGNSIMGIIQSLVLLVPQIGATVPRNVC